MNIIDQEKRNIQIRIDEILRAKQEAGMTGPTEIAAGIPVLKEHATEYKSLLRMQEIIANNMAQTGINEYLDSRSQTKLSPLPEEERETFMNPVTLRQVIERRLVMDRMKDLLNNDKYQSGEKVRANDGNWISSNSKVLEEYNNLDAMKTIINRNFSSKSYYDYYILRSKTALGIPSEGRYQALMGRPAKEDEIKPTVEGLTNNEPSIEPEVVPTPEVGEINASETGSVEQEPEVQAKPLDETIQTPSPQEEKDLMSELSQREEVVQAGPNLDQHAESQLAEPTLNEEPVVEMPAVVPDEQNLEAKKEETPEPILVLDDDSTPKKEEGLIPVEDKLITVEPKLTKEELMVATFKEEQARIQSRKNEIKSLYALADSSVQSRYTSDGNFVQDTHYPEYESLVQMDNILKTGLDAQNLENYLNLRSTTSLGMMDVSKQEKLMGKTQAEIEAEKNIPIQDNQGEISASIIDETSNIEPELPLQEQPGVIEEEITENPKPADNDNSQEESKEQLFEVVATKAWNWVKGHKKQILIGLGLTAITIATVVALTQLVPAIYAMTQAEAAATQASNIAGIAAEMIKNSELHHLSNAAEKVALHSANTGLGNLLSVLTKAPVNFNTTTYIWTIGSETLTEFVASSAASATAAAATAADAVAKVGLLSKASLALGVGGIGTLGVGLLAPKKSKEFLAIKEEIVNLVNTGEEKSIEEQTKTAQEISNKIIASNTLTEKERAILFKRLQRAIAKAKKMQTKNSFNMNSQQQKKEEVKKVAAEIIDGEQLPFDIKEELKDITDVNYTDVKSSSL